MRFVAVDDNMAEGVTVLTVFMDDETGSSVPWVVGEDHDRLSAQTTPAASLPVAGNNCLPALGRNDHSE
jgi:hypothetical protein